MPPPNPNSAVGRAHSSGTSGTSQDLSRATDIGGQLRGWDSMSIDSTNRQIAVRADLATAYAEIPLVITDPTIQAELEQEFRDVDAKIVAEIQAYAASITPIT